MLKCIVEQRLQLDALVSPPLPASARRSGSARGILPIGSVGITTILWTTFSTQQQRPATQVRHSAPEGRCSLSAKARQRRFDTGFTPTAKGVARARFSGMVLA
jgi:hypothetical protein